MEFRILGQLEAREGGQVLALGRGKERALLAVLLLSANRSVSVERLLDELWGEAVPETAAKAVQVYVSRLRKALPPGVVHTTRRGYLVEAPPGSLDLERAETLLEQGRSALAAGRAAEAREKLREALALWRGTALAEFTEPFAHAEGARLEELRLACLEERIDADLALRRESDLVGELEVLIARYPLRERARAQLMLALYRVGRQAGALAVYQDARRVLAEELGIEPSQSLRELQRRILNQDAALEPAPPASARGGLPWAVARPGRAGETQLLGRENELARLRGALERALAGRRELVFVTGGPGLGKTALVNAFLDEASAARGLLIARGQCLEQLGAGEPYMPVLEALGRLCREPDGRHLIALMRERAPTWLVQMPWLLPEGELGAVRQRTIGTTPERMLREMGELTHALAGEGAFALVLEDVHWSDPSTLDLLGALARGEEQARLLVIASYRPAEAARHPLYALARDLRARGRSSEVALAPLDADAVGAYLARRFPGNRFPPQVAAVLRKTSGGNPLFMEIVVDSWADEEAFHERDGAWELAVEPEVLAAGVADNLRGLIEQRIERLDLETQETLEAASIAGRRFAAAGVAGASGQTEEEVERCLDTLARHGELLAARGAEEWPDGTISAAYEFLHDLYPTVLYERVPPGRRTRLHKRLGHRLEQGYEESPGAIASVLASHFTRARHAEAAVPYLELAASNATARSAHREAIEHLIQALSLLGRLPAAEERDRRELRLQGLLASGLIATSGWSDTAAERALTRACELAERLGDSDALASALYRLASMYETRGEYTRSQALLEHALALPHESRDTGPLVDSHELLACSLLHQGAFDGALSHAEEGLRLFDGLHLDPANAAYGDDAAVLCHGWAALALWFLGHPDQALERALQGLALAEDPRHRFSKATACAQVAIVHQLRREERLTNHWADETIAIASGNGFAYRLAMGTVLRGWALAASGSSDAGLRELERGLELSRTTGAHMDEPYYLALLADAHNRAGHTTETLAAVDRAIELVHQSRGFFYEPELHRLRGCALLTQGPNQMASAAASLRQAHAQAIEKRSKTLQLRAAVSLARHLSANGHQVEARDLVTRAYNLLDEALDTPDLLEARELLEELTA